MNSRERVLKAFKLLKGLPDRVPIQFDLCRNLCDHFGKEYNIPVNYTENLYEDVTYRISANELRTAMGSDVVVTGASVSDNYKIVKDADGTWLNEYKMRMRQGDIYVEVVDYPLCYAETKSDILAFQFPEPDAPGRFRDAEHLVKNYHDNYLVFGDIEVTVFFLAHQLVGMEKLLIDMMLETEYVIPLFEACAWFQTQIGLRLIEKGVDAIWFGDDFGTNTGPFIPNEIYNEFFQPRHKIMCDYVKSNSTAHTMLHCCGGIYELIPELIEAGFEILNPVQINAVNMEPERLKKEFGNEITFWGGGCNTQSILNRATPQQVKDHVRHNLEIFGSGGGYVFNSIHNIMPDVPP
jgi:uroporphyrinogen decarboxylase